LSKKRVALRQKIRKGFEQLVRITNKRRAFIRTLKEYTWEGELSISFDATRWIGSTAERYAERRNARQEKLRSQLQQKRNVVHKKEIKPLVFLTQQEIDWRLYYKTK